MEQHVLNFCYTELTANPGVWLVHIHTFSEVLRSTDIILMRWFLSSFTQLYLNCFLGDL